MEMQTMLISAENGAAQASASSGAAGGGAAAGAASSRPDGMTFQARLNRLLSEAGEGGNAAGGGLAAGSVSGSAALLVLPQVLPFAAELSAEAEEMQKVLQLLLDLLEQARPDEMEQLLSNPELVEWALQAERLLGLGGNAPFEAETPAGASSSAANPGQSGLTGASVTAHVLKELFTALQAELARNPQDSDLLQLGRQLRAIMGEISVPSQSAAQQTESGENSRLPAKADKRADASAADGQRLGAMTGRENAKVVILQTEREGLDRGASQLQLLQRLAYLKTGSPVIVNGAAHEEAAAATGEAQALQAEIPAGQVAAGRGAADLLPASALKGGESSADGRAGAEPQISAYRFAGEMSRFLVKSMSFTQSPGMSEAKIKLVPEHLGQLDVKVVLSNGQLTAYFAVESPHARELLESQLPLLRAALQQQGIQVDKLEVSQHQSAESQLFQEQRGRHNQQSESKSGRTGKSYDDAELNFAQEIELAELTGMRMYGSTFEATA